MGKRSRSIQEEKQRKKKHLEASLPTQWHQLDDEDLEANVDEVFDYESAPRKFAGNSDSDSENDALPIIVNGRVHRVQKAQKSEEQEEDVDEDGEASDSAAEGEDGEEEDEEEEAEEMTETELKEMIATYAELINTEPEQHLGKVKELQQMAASTKKARFRQVLILSLLNLYQNIIPGYRIRPLTAAQQQEKVSRDVRQLREFEQQLLNCYKRYVELITAFSRQGKTLEQGKSRYAIARASLEAACGLLETAPHFNFRHELVCIVVGKLSSQRIDEPFNRAIECINTILDNDDEGHLSLEIVQQIGKMIRARRFKVDSRILTVLVGMQLLSDMPNATGDDEGGEIKLKKKDRVHLTKKQRKQRKEQKLIDEEMRKAETAVSAEVRAKMQNQVLQQVFKLYLEVMKADSKNLLSACLEGLAAYAHLINAELFGDLVEVLREVLDKSNSTRQSLLCIVTANTLLRGQGAKAATIDLTHFADKLYSVVVQMAFNPFIEQTHKSLVSSHKGKLASETDLLVRALEQQFSRRTTSRARTLAFARRLSLVAPLFPQRTCLVVLRVLKKLCEQHPYVRALLSTKDRVMRGSYDAEADTPDHANAEVATMWEISVLKNHYDENVRKQSGAL